MRDEKDILAPQFHSSTGGTGADRPSVEEELAAETGRIRRMHALLGAELTDAAQRARGGLSLIHI